MSELTIPTTFNWKKPFELRNFQSPKHPTSGGELRGWWEDPDDPVHVLHRCAPVVKELWKDPLVQKKLVEKRLRLEESSGLCVLFPLSGSAPLRLPQIIVSYSPVFGLCYPVTSTRSIGLLLRCTCQRMVGVIVVHKRD